MSKIETALKNVNRYLGFLFQKGFRIIEARDYPEINNNWEVTLGSQTCIIRIVCDRNQISIQFSPTHSEEAYRIDLKAMIYLISDGQRFIGLYKGNRFWGSQKQFAELGKLLQEYVDQLLPYFERDPEHQRPRLLAAQQQYNQLLVSSLRKS